MLAWLMNTSLLIAHAVALVLRAEVVDPQVIEAVEDSRESVGPKEA